MEAVWWILGGIVVLVVGFYWLVGMLAMLTGIIPIAAVMLVAFLLFGPTGPWVVFWILCPIAVVVGFGLTRSS